MTATEQGPSRQLMATLVGVGILTGVVVALLAEDVILGIIAAGAFTAIGVGLVRLWAGGGTRRPRHP